jgi:hypothetical protein
MMSYRSATTPNGNSANVFLNSLEEIAFWISFYDCSTDQLYQALRAVGRDSEMVRWFLSTRWRSRGALQPA